MPTSRNMDSMESYELHRFTLLFLVLNFDTIYTSESKDRDPPSQEPRKRKFFYEYEPTPMRWFSSILDHEMKLSLRMQKNLTPNQEIILIVEVMCSFISICSLFFYQPRCALILSNDQPLMLCRYQIRLQLMIDPQPQGIVGSLYFEQATSQNRQRMIRTQTKSVDELFEPDPRVQHKGEFVTRSDLLLVSCARMRFWYIFKFQ